MTEFLGKFVALVLAVAEKEGRMDMDVEQSENAIVQEGIGIFERLIDKVRAEIADDIGNPSTLDSDVVVLTYWVLHFWCMDAILRLVQDTAPNEDSINWQSTLKALSVSVRRFDLDLLVRVAFKSRNLRSIVDLVKIWICVDEYHREIQKRLSSFKFSKPFLRYLRSQGPAELAELFGVTADQISAWIKGYKKQFIFSDKAAFTSSKIKFEFCDFAECIINKYAK